MADNAYNGWTNWETWQINLWLDNEEPLYRDKVRFIRAGKLDDNSVKAFCFEYFPDGTPDMDPGDMSKVNWEEIGESFRREAEGYE